MLNPNDLTLSHAQRHQPWTVPYSRGVMYARDTDAVPHILASHTVLHAAKSVGKLATVFEKLDHSNVTGAINGTDRETIEAMSADLVTAALRFANLYSFNLAEVLLRRIEEKNGVQLPPMETE